MSTPRDTPEASAERRSSLGRYVKRMSSVFKREKAEKAAKSTATAAPSTAPASVPTAPATAPADGEAAPAPRAATKPEPSAGAGAPAASHAVAHTPAKQIDRSALQQERARALFSKYGLTLEAHEWVTAPVPAGAVQRVEKAIRMRVHRTCHHCGTVYGSGKVCVKCAHKRCKSCPRYPRKKTPAEREREAARDAAAAAGAAPGDGAKPKKKRLLTYTTRSGEERAYAPPKQKIRRACHKCDALFVPPTATACASCAHVRCTKCPREPAKLTKWPAGYPGDAEAESDAEEVEKQLDRFRRTWRKPRQRVRWECEVCAASFVVGDPHCPGCGHERCDKCTRSPTRKALKTGHFDPEIVAAVQAKLRALGVDDSDEE